MHDTPKQPRIAVVYGTRPEAIKLAPVISCLKESKVLDSLVISTGQHPQMLPQVHKVFNIEPDLELNVMSPGQSLNQLAAKILVSLSELLEKHQVQALLVQGDTTTVMAAAIAAFNQHIPVIHLEAGLRSGNLDLPFPEEANRKITGQVAALHLAPTTSARDNLLRENVEADKIVVTGNTVIDALHTVLSTSFDLETEIPQLATTLNRNTKKVLITMHRRESWGKAIERVTRALGELCDEKPQVDFIVPAHANPQIRNTIEAGLKSFSNAFILDPLPYQAFTHLLARVDLVVTDSGGVQEEAPALGKPVLVLRETTERPEALAAGTVRLIGTQEGRVKREILALLEDENLYETMAKAVNPYGDGKAGPRVIAAISQLLGVGKRLSDFGS